MTTYYTDEPLGSPSAKVLYDNTQNFDHLSNDQVNELWKDRFGVDRLTWYGMEKRYQEKLSSMGWSLIDSFQDGATLTRADQALRWALPDGDGEYYRWDGALPKTVPSGSTPESSGGVGVGAWIGVGDSSLRSMLASTSGTSMIGRPSGGWIQDTIPEFYVDEFGADPTGATSSTAAVNAALAAINSVVDSRLNKNTSIKYAKLIFGKGVYQLKDIPIKSGVCYEGQDDYATRIEPEAGGAFCFTTVGTIPFETGGESGRMFRASFKNLLIGYDLQRIYSTVIPQNNIGGIRIEYASYVTLRDVQFNTIDGIGLQLAEVWDADFDNCRFLNCGNTRSSSNPRWSLMIYAGLAATDGCNNLRFTSLHIENADAGLYVGPRSQRIHFEGAKLELGKTPATTISNIIAGTNGVMWNNARLSWSIGTLPMFSMAGTSIINDTTSDDESDYNCNHNRRLVFRDIELLNSQNNTGWYFEYGSGRGPLLIEGGTGHHMRYLVTGSNFIVSDFCAVQSGPLLISGTGDVIINDLVCYRHRVPTSGSANVITLTGVGNRVSRSRFYTPYGSSTDGNVWIVSNSSSTLYVNDCEFAGSFGNAIQPGSDANARRCTNNRLISGATYGNLIVGFPAYGNLPARLSAATAGTISDSKVIVVDGTATLTIGGATKLLVRLRNNAGAYLSAGEFFTDPNATVIEQQDTGTKFSVNGSGVSGDGQVWLSQSGGTMSIVNRTTTAITVNIGGIAAEL